MYTSKNRLLSLDAFRGLCMIGMILVDYPGDWGHVYAPFVHAKWNGFLLADLVFPAFLFIVGVAMIFSLAKRKEKGDSHSDIMKQVFRRAFILFFLGMLSNAFFAKGDLIHTLKTFRVLGVLQRIALVYIICAYLYLKFDVKKLAWIGGGILLAYWAIITLIPVPGFGMPDINIHPGEKIANISAWFDAKILGEHIAEWNKPFDNEGLISTIPAIVTCILGMIVGAFIKSDRNEATKTSWLFIAGGVSIIVGYIWGVWYPINKLLWSGSFVIYSGGWSIMILAGFYWLIDAKGCTSWSRPFQIFGKNAILVFTAAACFQGAFWRIPMTLDGQASAFRWVLYSKAFKPLAESPYFTSMLYTLAVLLFWYGVSYFLNRKRIYLRV